MTATMDMATAASVEDARLMSGITARHVALAAGMHGHYPETFHDFVGQESAKRALLVAARSAAIRGTTCSHILLASGVAGIGKTSLALLVAAELKRPIKVVSGKLKLADARRILLSMSDGAVLFWDEFHLAVQGGKADAEWLLHLLQDGVLMTPRGPLKVPSITVIAATTDVGKLPDTIVSRFQVKPVLESYTDDEAFKIAKLMAREAFVTEAKIPVPSDADIVAVAAAANNTPRYMRALLEAMRDLAVVDGSYIFDEALELAGLTRDGLTRLARRYLVCLYNADAPMGVAPLGEALQEKGNLAATEKLLLDKGFITFTKSGRDLTGAGLTRTADLVKEH